MNKIVLLIRNKIDGMATKSKLIFAALFGLCAVLLIIFGLINTRFVKHFTNELKERVKLEKISDFLRTQGWEEGEYSAITNIAEISASSSSFLTPEKTFNDAIKATRKIGIEPPYSSAEAYSEGYWADIDDRYVNLHGISIPVYGSRLFIYYDEGEYNEPVLAFISLRAGYDYHTLPINTPLEEMRKEYPIPVEEVDRMERATIIYPWEQLLGFTPKWWLQKHGYMDLQKIAEFLNDYGWEDIVYSRVSRIHGEPFAGLLNDDALFKDAVEATRQLGIKPLGGEEARYGEGYEGYYAFITRTIPGELKYAGLFVYCREGEYDEPALAFILAEQITGESTTEKHVLPLDTTYEAILEKYAPSEYERINMRQKQLESLQFN